MSGKDGRFVIRVASKPSLLFALGGGWLSETLSGTDGPVDARKMRLDPSDWPGTIDVRVIPSGTLRGRVTRPSGAPVQGLAVAAAAEEWPPEVQGLDLLMGVSDARGVFQIDGVPPRGGLEVMAGERWGDLDASRRVSEEERGAVRIVMPDRCWLSTRVFFRGRQVSALVRVAADMVPGTRAAAYRAHADCAVVIGPLNGAKQTVVVESVEGRPAPRNHMELRDKRGLVELRIDLVD
jgi:hypothetical protein